MKIDQSKVKRGTSEVPADCKALIDKLRGCQHDHQLLVNELKSVKSWTFGKCELFHWTEILDLFDEILEKSCMKESEKVWLLPVDRPDNTQLKDLLIHVLHFTALLIEHSFSRHLYNSMEHVTALMASSDMHIVLAVLNLLYVFSKRSNFITRMAADKKQALVLRLTHLAESWGGKENGFGLADCCRNQGVASFPPSATTLHFEFYAESTEEKQSKKSAPSPNVLSVIHIENLDKVEKLPAQIMEDILDNFNIPRDKYMFLFTHIRLAHSFSDYEKRIQCVQARLQAISILVYSNAMADNVNSLLYTGLIEELVDILEINHCDNGVLLPQAVLQQQEPKLMEIKAASLRTLTSIIHLERNPKLNAIIDATGAASYHGFLPILVRNCIQHMCDDRLEAFPQPFATALFSFLYHLASYESGKGGEALESCGMMEALLRVINWYSEGQEHITFVTRAVRVIDLITNLDMAAFQTHHGLAAFINRLEHEVDICRSEQPFVIEPRGGPSSTSGSGSGMDSNPASPASPPIIENQPQPMDTDQSAAPSEQPSTSTATSTSKNDVDVTAGTSTSSDAKPDYSGAKTGLSCFPQRAALLKSMLNFLKKAIPDPAFSESIRHLMDGSLPRSLKHVISNAEYYGPSLFLLATDVVTVYVFQEPSLLSSLQDNRLTDVVLHALLIKDVPATREVLASLPNVFSALCLNARGLAAFVACKPFERLFKVLLSPDYLPAMRRRRSSNPLGDTASNLGNAMDELMRHQPSLRTDATKAIIQLLEEVAAMGEDPRYVCQKPPAKNESAAGSSSMRSPTPNEVSSDEDEDDDDMPPPQANSPVEGAPDDSGAKDDETPGTPSSEERKPIPLIDYVLNVMKFVEAILSNNTTDDHCREFVTQNGLTRLMKILGMPNLPIDFPVSPSCQAVGTVCKAIFTLSREAQVLKEGLLQLNNILLSLEPLHTPLDAPGGSVLLRELVSAPCSSEGPMLSSTSTPLLHALSAAHAYITMFVQVCRVGQTDIRSISVSQWGSDLGLQVLKGLSQLYTSLVWESTVLLALCSEDILPPGCEFGRSDMEKLLPKSQQEKPQTSNQTETNSASSDSTSNGMSAAMEGLTTQEANSPMAVDIEEVIEDKKVKLSPSLQAQIKQIKPLLSASSRLGRALAELFGLLVKLCVGSPVRQRSRQQIIPQPIARTPAARAVASALTKLLANGLSWEPPPTSPVPKLRLTFYICSVGFTSPMLFDESKFAFHLMLQNFLSSGGQDALFQAFTWALSCGGRLALTDGLENADLPDGTGEFLDAWLMLVEKMVNTRNILESQHTVPEKPSQLGAPAFSPVHYLIKTHKAAFHAILNLWDKTPLKVYGSRMSECILAILCHIIRGETIIADMLKKKEKEKSASSSSNNGGGSGGTGSNGGNNTSTGDQTQSATSQPADEPIVNDQHLQTLMDMGFSREHCISGLLHTTSLEQATDFLLNRPLIGGLGASALGLGAELDMSEDELMVQAIAQSMSKATTNQTETSTDPPEKRFKASDPETEEEPLAKPVLDHFFDNMMSGCLKLLDALPETVYRICDLLLLVTQRNSDTWRDDVLRGLVTEVMNQAGYLLERASPLKSSDDRTVAEWASQLSGLPESSKLAARLHLLSLLFEDLKMACAAVVEQTGLIPQLISLLDAGQHCLSKCKDAATPKWLAPLMLLIDQYCKVTVSSRRHQQVKRLLGSVRVWKWFDDRSGRWCTYSTSNNKTIDDAYSSGLTSIRFTAGRRKYTVHFSTMVQVNEDTGNRRPIMLSLPSKEEREKAEKKAESKAEEKEEKMETDDSSDHITPAEKPPPSFSDVTEKISDDVTRTKSDVIAESMTVESSVEVLTPEQIDSLITSCVGLIALPVEADSLHAVLRLCLRLTRHHHYALKFAQLNGVKLLLGLTQNSAFQGFTSLATLLIRHVLEDAVILRQLMEKVVRNPSSGNNTSLTGVAQSSIGAIELHYVMRLLSPAACRDPELSQSVMKDAFSVVVPSTAPGKSDDSRLVGPNAAQILKMAPLTGQKPVQVDGLMREVVHELLNALAVKYTWLLDDATLNGSCEVKAAQTLAEAIQEVVNEVARDMADRHDIIRTDTAAENALMATDGSQASEGSSTSKDVTSVKSSECEKKKRPLLPKSAIMRLLAELVKSYACCANLIVQHHFPAAISELVPEECSVMAFILDQLLPQCQRSGDKDCPALARVLIASIASCAACQDAQQQLVTEVKAATQRALVLPESSDKHSRLQALANIISTMIESCSPTKHQLFKSQPSPPVGMNSMVKLLVKKGVMTDLSRIPHALDLSSPHMAQTVNCALKPLEILSRIMNQPHTVLKKKESKSPPGGDTTQTETEGTSAAEDTVTDTVTEELLDEVELGTEGEHDEEDEDRTSQEDVVTLESVRPEIDQAEEVLRQVDELEDVLDDILRGDSNRERTAEQNVLADIIIAATGAAEGRGESQGEDIEDDTDEEQIIDVDGHDSQMVSQLADHRSDQELSDDEGGGGGGGGVRIRGRRVEDSGSESDDEDRDDDNQDEDDDEDEQMDGAEDDDEEDDEDDEGSDMEGDAEYNDVVDDDSILRRVGEDMRRLGDDSDLFLHLDDVMPGVVFNDSSQIRTYQLPIAGHDNNDNGNDALPSLPPAPSNVTSNHPLLVRHADAANTSNSMSTRVHRHGFGRQRGTYRYSPTTQTLHVHYTAGSSRHPNPPAILQRLLGPDHLRLTNSLSSQGASSAATRVYVTDDPYIRMLRPEEDIFDIFEESGESASGSGVLVNVPSALTRWTEESRVLDGDSVHDCVLLLKPGIVGALEAKRERELATRKEKQAREPSAEKREEKKEEVGAEPASSSSAQENNTETVAPSTREEELESTPSAAAAASRSIMEEPAHVVSRNTSDESSSSAASSSSTSSTTSSRTPASRTDERNTLAALMADTVAISSSGDPAPAPVAPPTTDAAGAPAAAALPAGPGPITLDALSRAFAAVSTPPLTQPHGTAPVDTGITAEAVAASLASALPESLRTNSANTTSSESTPVSPPMRNLFGGPLTADIGQFFNLNAPMDSSAMTDPRVWDPLAPPRDSAPSWDPLRASPFEVTPHEDAMAPPTVPPTGQATSQSEMTSSEVGVAITPEEQSNVTSSDAVTVHSTPSGSSSEEASLSMPVDSTVTGTETESERTRRTSETFTSSILGELPRPEDVDPSFLAALPENIRQEVVNEQLRLARIQERAEQQNQLASQGDGLGVTEVNPEFLAALPPSIQEEVLAQQRAEQARLAAAANPPAANNAPATAVADPTATAANVDPTSFIATLPTSLRQQVLADMDDSMMAVLPPTLAAEAQTLRRELEDRHRRLMQDRLFTQSGAASLSAILRLSRFGSRSGFRSRPSGHHWQWASQCRGALMEGRAAASQMNLRGRHLLDHEALTCLLVLLFVDEPKLNTNRLHRVLRNLCYHVPTRAWLFRSLLSIIHRTGEARPSSDDPSRPAAKDHTKSKKGAKSSLDLSYKSEGSRNVQPAWLSISLDAALGCRANVFQIQRSGGKKHIQPSSVTIHPQAAPVVCRHVLDTLISLAKSFPSHFAPKNSSAAAKTAAAKKCDSKTDVSASTTDDTTTASTNTGTTTVATSKSKTASPARTSQSGTTASKAESDFWEQLIKLDQTSCTKKGKGVQRAHSNPSLDQDVDDEPSPLGQLLSMLAHPVIKRSQLLTDRLLRLLGLVSVGFAPGEVRGAGHHVTGVGAGRSMFARVGAELRAEARRLETAANNAENMDTSTTDGAKDKEAEKEEEESPLLESQLQLAVQVLTSKSCSEDGLEDATNLLLQLSKTNANTRNTVLRLLLAGASQLGETVCQHIGQLLCELQEVKQRSPDDLEPEVDSLEALAAKEKGVLNDRFSTGQNIVVKAPTKIKAGRELQLPSMVLLTNKASSQQFFLRILKVIIQLRDAARAAARKKTKRTDSIPFLDADEEGAEDISSEGRQTAAEATSATSAATSAASATSTAQATSATEAEVTSAASATSAAASETSQATSDADSHVPSVVPMDTDSAPDVTPGPSVSKESGDSSDSPADILPRLSEQLGLDALWDTLGECLTELSRTPDHHAVLVLQPAVEAFFLVHAGESDSKKPRDGASAKKEDQLSHLNVDLALPQSPAPSSSQELLGLLSRDNSMASVAAAAVPPDTSKFLKFAETHRTVLNQILRQSTTPLADGPFNVLVDHTRVLDFDVKRRYFRQELQRVDESMRREDLAVHVRREHVFEDSFRELFRRSPDEWKHRFYIIFEGEEGQDAGGLLREWYLIIAREIFNPMYALFCTSSGDRVTYTINPSSHCNSNHLSYFKFVGRIIAKAIYDNKLLECYFTRSFYKHMLGVPVKYTDMEHEDYAFSQGLLFLLEHSVDHLGYDVTFSTEIQEFGVNETRDLIPNGRNIAVHDENKKDYIKLVCQMKMTGAIRKQLNSFLEGFYDIIPKRLISIFNEQELELLLSGLPTIDIDDLKANTEYHKYQSTSLQIQWFWRALRAFDQADRARFLQFVTGTSKVPLQGFTNLEGMNGVQKFQIHRDDRSTDRLPSAHTCFNQLDLPAYETYDKLKHMLLLAINECSEGFGLA